MQRARFFTRRPSLAVLDDLLLPSLFFQAHHICRNSIYEFLMITHQCLNFPRKLLYCQRVRSCNPTFHL